MRALRIVLALSAVLIVAPLAFASGASSSKDSVKLPSSSASAVTVYGADWCSACKSLERGLKERDIPFEVIDVDRNPQAYAKARQETGSNGIPVTSVARASDVQWIVGANAAAVERAYRGE